MTKKTHADKIREAVNDLGIASPREIMDWIRRHYPNDTVNPRSYRADIIGCSINHSSSHHYPGVPKFLWFEKETKGYRLASPEEASKVEHVRVEEKSQSFLETEQGVIDGIPIAKLSVTGQVKIPAMIREKLGLRPGDILAFIVKDDVLEVRKARMRLEIE